MDESSHSRRYTTSACTALSIMCPLEFWADEMLATPRNRYVAPCLMDSPTNSIFTFHPDLLGWLLAPQFFFTVGGMKITESKGMMSGALPPRETRTLADICLEWTEHEAATSRDRTRELARLIRGGALPRPP